MEERELMQVWRKTHIAPRTNLPKKLRLTEKATAIYPDTPLHSTAELANILSVHSEIRFGPHASGCGNSACEGGPAIAVSVTSPTKYRAHSIASERTRGLSKVQRSN